MKNTKDIIFAQALQLFNDQGIDTAGIREIARLLNLSPGNVSYYFPSKTDLVISIFDAFENRQNELLKTNASIKDWNSLKPLLEKSLRLQDEFRCLFISVNALASIPELVERIGKMEAQRRGQLCSLLKQLTPVTAGHIDFLLIVHHLLLAFRFRLLDAQLRPVNQTESGRRLVFLQDTRKFLSLFFVLN